MSASEAHPAPPPERIDLADEASVSHWRDQFGVTVEQLSEAVAAVGSEADAVAEHLLNQGASAGAG